MVAHLSDTPCTFLHQCGGPTGPTSSDSHLSAYRASGQGECDGRRDDHAVWSRGLRPGGCNLGSGTEVYELVVHGRCHDLRTCGRRYFGRPQFGGRAEGGIGVRCANALLVSRCCPASARHRGTWGVSNPNQLSRLGCSCVPARRTDLWWASLFDFGIDSRSWNTCRVFGCL